MKIKLLMMAMLVLAVLSGCASVEDMCKEDFKFYKERTERCNENGVYRDLKGDRVAPPEKEEISVESLTAKDTRALQVWVDPDTKCHYLVYGNSFYPRTSSTGSQVCSN